MPLKLPSKNFYRYRIPGEVVRKRDRVRSDGLGWGPVDAGPVELQRHFGQFVGSRFPGLGLVRARLLRSSKMEERQPGGQDQVRVSPLHGSRFVCSSITIQFFKIHTVISTKTFYICWNLRQSWSNKAMEYLYTQ